MDHAKTICAEIQRTIKGSGFYVIGIDGLGGAGKSTVSEEITSELEQLGIYTVLLHIDDFINVRSVRYNEVYPQWQCYYDFQWRYDHFREVIETLRRDGKVTAEIYDKENDNYLSTNYCTKECTVVIVEGIFLQRRELDGIFDHMVYLDVPEDVRLNRVLERDTYIGNETEIRNKYENRYFPAERRYVNEYLPAEKADTVIGC